MRTCKGKDRQMARMKTRKTGKSERQRARVTRSSERKRQKTDRSSRTRRRDEWARKWRREKQMDGVKDQIN